MVRDQVRAFSEEISRFSKLAVRNTMTVHRESLVQIAAENPDIIAEIGVLDSYHGKRVTAEGAVEHYFRITFAASLQQRTGIGESAVYPQIALVRHTEELAKVEMKGVRDVDAGVAWFTLCRNGLIRLSGDITARLGSITPDQGKPAEGVVAADGSVQWKSTPPGPFVPLDWIRPLGELRDGGETLGSYYERMSPGLGFLNAKVLGSEKLKAGDVLFYVNRESTSLPLAGIRVTAEAAPAWFADTGWATAIIADRFGSRLKCRFVLLGRDGNDRQSVSSVVQVGITALSALAQPGKAAFTGQWRVQILPSHAGEGVVPLLKFGIQSEAHIAHAGERETLDTPDWKGWGLEYMADALQKLAEMASTKGTQHLLSEGE